MVTHSSILAWRIPQTEESGGLQSIGSHSQTQLKRLSTHTLPAMQETQVQSLGWEDPLEMEMANHSSILVLDNPMDRGAYRPRGHKSRT